MAKKPNKTKEVMSVVDRAKDFFKRASEYESDQRTEEVDDIRFSGLLEQWPPLIKQIRENDPTGARPCMVVDKVNQYKNQIVNAMRENRASIKVRPVDDTADIEVAEVFEGLIRHIQDQSKADIAYDWAGEGAVTSGIGYFRILTEYVDDSFNQEIRIARIRNRFSVYYDPNSKEPDGSDCKECIITENVPRKAFEDMYPDCDVSNWDTATGDGDWWDKDTVRIAEYFYIEKNQEDLYLLDDGNSIFASDYLEKYLTVAETEEPPEQSDEMPHESTEEMTEDMPMDGMMQIPQVVDKRKANKITVKWAKLAGGEDKPLKETTFPGKYIPVIPVIGIETDIDGKRHLRGVVRGVKDAQRLYNYERSTVAESLNLTVKAPFIGAVGQFKTKDAEWASANRVNYSKLEYDPVSVNNTLVPPPVRQGFAGVPSGLLTDMQTSEHDIQSALGMYQSSIGQDGNAKSGIAMNAQQRAGDMATFQFPDNQSKSIRHAGRILIDIIPIVIDKKQALRILGEDGSVDYANVNPSLSAAKLETRGQDGAIKKIYNLGVGKYDVTATVGASYATKRMEGAEFMTQIAQSNPDLVSIIGDLMFKAMDMPYADDVAKRLKMMLPPPIQQALAAEKEGENPEVQEVKQQAKQIIDQLTQQLEAAHQAMQEADQEAAELKQGNDVKIVEAQADAEKESARANADAKIAQEQAAQDRYNKMLDLAGKIVVEAMKMPAEQQIQAAETAVAHMSEFDEEGTLQETVSALMQMAQNMQNIVPKIDGVVQKRQSVDDLMSVVLQTQQAILAPRQISLQTDANGNVVGGVSEVLQ